MERRRELLRLVEPEPEISQMSRLIALIARDLDLGRHPRMGLGAWTGLLA